MLNIIIFHNGFTFLNVVAFYYIFVASRDMISINDEQIGDGRPSSKYTNVITN